VAGRLTGGHRLRRPQAPDPVTRRRGGHQVGQTKVGHCTARTQPEKSPEGGGGRPRTGRDTPSGREDVPTPIQIPPPDFPRTPATASPKARRNRMPTEGGGPAQLSPCGAQLRGATPVSVA
jgi:hypothetical protein